MVYSITCYRLEISNDIRVAGARFRAKATRTVSENSSLYIKLSKTSLEDVAQTRRSRERPTSDSPCLSYPSRQFQKVSQRQQHVERVCGYNELRSSPMNFKFSTTCGRTGGAHGDASCDYPKVKYTAYNSNVASQSSDNHLSKFTLLKQPATPPISMQNLINEVKRFYPGLVMAEEKCIEIVTQQSQSTKRLENQQWKALVALHRTLLQEHDDFFSASQYPIASDALERLAIKYAMPARMWRHGIHAFLELLRHRLQDSTEHMLSFIYLSYSMSALLKESVPVFVETWIECLGDLARYRMAIEDSDPRDREIWSNVARMWYNEAADKSPNMGRIQHHLAVLARPNIVEQLLFYTKALMSVKAFADPRESIMLLFDMFVENNEQARYLVTERSLIQDFAILFTRGKMPFTGDQASLIGTTGHLGCFTNNFQTNTHQPSFGAFRGQLPEDFFYHGYSIARHYVYPEELSTDPLVNSDNSSASPDRRKADSSLLSQVHCRLLRFWKNINRCLGARSLSLLNIGMSTAYPVGNATTPNTSDQSSLSNSNNVWDIVLLILPIVLPIAALLIGSRSVHIHDRVTTAALLSVVSIALVGAAAEGDLPIFFKRVSTVMSIGSSVWLMIDTRDKDEWGLFQIGRYTMLTMICHYGLQALFIAKSEGGLNDKFLEQTIWLWSFFGSVAINGLCNPVLQYMKHCAGWIGQSSIQRRRS